MKSKKKLLKIHTVRVYVGYGAKGAERKLAIIQKAGRHAVSRMMIGALKKVYPSLPL